MMKKVILFLLLIPYSLSLSGQSHKIDSLNAALKTEKVDTNRVNTLNELSFALLVAGKYDTSSLYANKAIDLAGKQDFKKGMAKALRIAGEDYDKEGNYPSALDDYIKALNIYKELSNQEEIANEYSNIGGIYWNQGDFPKSLEYYLKAMEISKARGDKRGIASDLLDIGDIYEDEGNPSKGMEYYFKSMAIYKELNDKDGIAGNLCDIGNAYSDEGNDGKALQFYYLALQIELQLGNQRSIARNYGNMGNIYEDMGNYSQALQCEFKALDIDTRVGYKKGTSSKMLTISSIYRREKKYALSKLYVDSSLNVAKRIGVKEYIASAYGEMVQLDKSMGDYKQALDDYQKRVSYNDSLVNDANTRKIIQAGMNFEFQQKQSAEKAEQVKKDALATQEQKKQIIIRDAFMAGFLLVLALAFLIFRGYRQKQKANEMITFQKELVEEKQKEMLDSIHYAERIQKALLASDEMLRGNLEDYFVLYKPKDIVSGDFYWATQKDKRFYLAVCDSTGHGVPGAFMSLLNISFLNEAINEKNMVNPDDVFNHTRKRLIENVSQDGGQDGMDGILASVLTSDEGMKLVYAAAYNTPVIVRKGEVIETGADKVPVGKSPKDSESFSLRSAELKKGDMLYFFTDGYADQFGGDKGKKYKYSQWLKLLLSVCSKTMAEQKAFLENAFESWKGNLEQTDDVCIVGIRV